MAKYVNSEMLCIWLYFHVVTSELAGCVYKMCVVSAMIISYNTMQWYPLVEDETDIRSHLQELDRADPTLYQ